MPYATLTPRALTLGRDPGAAASARPGTARAAVFELPVSPPAMHRRGPERADLALLLGRLALVAIYLTSGVGMVENLGMLEAMLDVGGVRMPALVAVATVVGELGAAIAIAFGWRVRPAALALVGFTAVATLLFHPFWAVPLPVREEHFVHFMKNLGLAGGLLLVSAAGPGWFSLTAALAAGRPVPRARR